MSDYKNYFKIILMISSVILFLNFTYLSYKYTNLSFTMAVKNVLINDTINNTRNKHDASNEKNAGTSETYANETRVLIRENRTFYELGINAEEERSSNSSITRISNITLQNNDESTDNDTVAVDTKIQVKDLVYTGKKEMDFSRTFHEQDNGDKSASIQTMYMKNAPRAENNPQDITNASDSTIVVDKSSGTSARSEIVRTFLTFQNKHPIVNEHQQNGKVPFNNLVLHKYEPMKLTVDMDVRNTRCQDCFAHNFRYILNNGKICSNDPSNDTIDLVIMILSSPGNIAARMALRTTWLTYAQQNTGSIRYVFLLGETKSKTIQNMVEEENRKFLDLVQEDFADSYMNLTYKTVMGFKWVVNFCSSAKYVIKTDDDMYLNIPNFTKFLNTDGYKLENNFAGSCNTGAPNRNIKSKWYASVSSYKETKYPGFCSGTCYVTSMNLARKIYNVSSGVPFFHLEDVYIGLCLRQVGGSIINLPGFNRIRVMPTDPCIYKGNDLFTSHNLTPEIIQNVWEMSCRPKS